MNWEYSALAAEVHDLDKPIGRSFGDVEYYTGLLAKVSGRGSGSSRRSSSHRLLRGAECPVQARAEPTGAIRTAARYRRLLALRS